MGQQVFIQAQKVIAGTEWEAVIFPKTLNEKDRILVEKLKAYEAKANEPDRIKRMEYFWNEVFTNIEI